MGVRRLDDIPGFNIDRVAAAAGDDPHVLRPTSREKWIRRSSQVE